MTRERPITPSELRIVPTAQADGVQVDVYQTGYADPRPMSGNLSDDQVISLVSRLLERLAESRAQRRRWE